MNIVNNKISLEEIMKEGWSETLEFGFGRKSVLYSKNDYRMIYDAENELIVTTYFTGKVYKQSG